MRLFMRPLREALKEGDLRATPGVGPGRRRAALVRWVPARRATRSDPRIALRLE